ncbi:MAG: hypothetical protein WC304_00660, partial [Candidatus Gracilibacteria bacterium]
IEINNRTITLLHFISSHIGKGVGGGKRLIHNILWKSREQDTGYRIQSGEATQKELLKRGESF